MLHAKEKENKFICCELDLAYAITIHKGASSTW